MSSFVLAMSEIQSCLTCFVKSSTATWCEIFAVLIDRCPGDGAVYTTGAGAADTAGAGVMYSTTGTGAAMDTGAEEPRISDNMGLKRN